MVKRRRVEFRVANQAMNKFDRSVMCVQVLGAEPGFTSCHGRVIATLDYMWFTRLLHTPTPAAQRTSSLQASEPSSQQPSISADPAGRSLDSSGAASSECTSGADGHKCSSSGISSADHSQRGRLEQLGVAGASSGTPGGPTVAGGAPGARGLGVSAVAGGWELVPTRVAMVPPLRSLHSGLPAPDYPSDHISLVAEFSVRSLRPADGVPVPGVFAPRTPAPAAPAALAVPGVAAAPQVPQHIFFDDED